MSNRITIDEADAIAVAYFKNKLDEAEALMEVGYKESYARRGGKKLFQNVNVMAAITRLREKARTMEDPVTLKDITKMLHEDRDGAAACRQYGACTAASKALANIYGHDKLSGSEQVIIVIGPKPDDLIPLGESCPRCGAESEHQRKGRKSVVSQEKEPEGLTDAAPELPAAQEQADE